MKEKIKEMALEALIQSMDDGIMDQIKKKRDPKAMIIEETEVDPMDSCEIHAGMDKMEESVEKEPMEKLGMQMIKKSLGKRR